MNQRGTIATAGLELALLCPPAYSQQRADKSHNFGATDLVLRRWVCGRVPSRSRGLGDGPLRLTG